MVVVLPGIIEWYMNKLVREGDAVDQINECSKRTNNYCIQPKTKTLTGTVDSEKAKALASGDTETQMIDSALAIVVYLG